MLAAAPIEPDRIGHHSVLSVGEDAEPHSVGALEASRISLIPIGI